MTIHNLPNILANLSSGMLPIELSSDEVGLLTLFCGEGWFEKLGYSEPEYKRPKHKFK